MPRLASRPTAGRISVLVVTCHNMTGEMLQNAFAHARRDFTIERLSGSSQKIISELGGLIGILLGLLGGNLVAMMLNIPPVIPYNWVAIGFLSCSIVGIVFGVYPAWKASNLDPIESLRYE